MKVTFLTLTALALSVSFAMADCPSHSAQSTKTEKPLTTASIQSPASTQK
jgi:hypothetical protein